MTLETRVQLIAEKVNQQNQVTVFILHQDHEQKQFLGSEFRKAMVLVQNQISMVLPTQEKEKCSSEVPSSISLFCVTTNNDQRSLVLEYHDLCRLLYGEQMLVEKQH